MITKLRIPYRVLCESCHVMSSSSQLTITFRGNDESDESDDVRWKSHKHHHLRFASTAASGSDSDASVGDQDQVPMYFTYIRRNIPYAQIPSY